MKVLITSDFYTDFEMYETSKPMGLKNYVALMANGIVADLDESQHKLIGTSDTMTTEEALKKADKVIFTSDFVKD